jgi:hypothetical protein
VLTARFTEAQRLTTLGAGYRLSSEMAITFEYGGAKFTVNTPQEAAEMIALLKRQEAEAAVTSMRVRFSELQETYEKELLSLNDVKFLWTPDRFRALIDRLGEAQKLALGLLITRRSMTDRELREALRVPNNQALAGILSGISKQAQALVIPPRAIFDFENIRVGGKRRSDYLVVDEFRKVAVDLNWPPASLLSKAAPSR